MDGYAAARDRGESHASAERVFAAAVEPQAPERAGARAFLAEIAEVLRIPTIRFVYPGVAVALAGLTGLGFWLPTFLERSHGLGEGVAAAITSAVMVAGALGGAATGGVLGDRWHGRRPRSRVAITTLGLFGAGVGLALALTIDALAAQAAVFFVATFSFGLSIPNLAAVTADVLPAAKRGAGFSLFQLLATISIAVGPLAVGALSDATGSLRAALLALLPLTLLGAALVRGARRHVEIDSRRALAAAGAAPIDA
jgi:MFS family permease